jgi:anti-sigma factor RsiW
MTHLPECRRIEPLLPALYDQLLSETEAQRVTAHVAGCARCTARLAQVEQLDHVLRQASQPVPGPALRQVLARRKQRGASYTDDCTGWQIAGAICSGTETPSLAFCFAYFCRCRCATGNGGSGRRRGQSRHLPQKYERASRRHQHCRSAEPAEGPLSGK